MTDREHVDRLIATHGNPRRAALAFNERAEALGLEYRMDLTSTMQRIADGRGKSAMLALVRLVLESGN